jgi:hypothetical protein
MVASVKEIGSVKDEIPLVARREPVRDHFRYCIPHVTPLTVTVDNYSRHAQMLVTLIDPGLIQVDQAHVIPSGKFATRSHRSASAIHSFQIKPRPITIYSWNLPIALGHAEYNIANSITVFGWPMIGSDSTGPENAIEY